MNLELIQTISVVEHRTVFGSMLYLNRISQGKSVTDIANELGVSESAIYKKEKNYSGERMIKFKKLNQVELTDIYESYGIDYSIIEQLNKAKEMDFIEYYYEHKNNMQKVYNLKPNQTEFLMLKKRYKLTDKFIAKLWRCSEQNIGSLMKSNNDLKNEYIRIIKRYLELEV